MSLTRAEKLINGLTGRELQQFDREVETQRRESLKKLYSVVKRNVRRKKKMEKLEIFQQVFGREYSRKEDYLLRHELRLLTDRLYDFLARTEALRELERNPSLRDRLLISALMERHLMHEFEGLFRKSRERAEQAHDYQNLQRLEDLHFRYLIIYREVTPEALEAALESARTNLGTIKLRYRADMAQNQNHRIVCEESLLVMGRDTVRTTVGADDDVLSVGSPLVDYFEESSLTHQTSGNERLEHARRAVESISRIADSFPEQLVTAQAILASGYFIEHQYEEAEKAFETMLGSAQEHGVKPRPDTIFNYVGTLMRLGKYERALDLIEQYGTQIGNIPKLKFRFECYRCFCRIFLNDPAEALAAIPPAISQRPESEYQYFRFIHTIIPYLQGEPEQGLRESRNFADYFNRHRDTLLYPKEKRAVDLFRRFYTVLLDEPDRAERNRKLEELLEGVEQFQQEAPEYRNYLWLKWLEGTLREIISA